MVVRYSTARHCARLRSTSRRRRCRNVAVRTDNFTTIGARFLRTGRLAALSLAQSSCVSEPLRSYLLTKLILGQGIDAHWEAG